MSTLSQSPSGLRTSGGLMAAFKTLADEAAVLVQALLQPGRIIEEVEQMRALQVEAGRIEGTDPAQAAKLRRRASQIGLRRG